MNVKQQLRDSEEMARRWHALAERRREHFADLYNSGRWRKYYREHDFLSQMRDTARMTDAWENVTRLNGAASARLNGVAHAMNGATAF
jgi:uncharacterized repeat protein (TIGR03809 family)